MIDKRKFKDLNVSLLGLGTMRLPCSTPVKREANPAIDYESAQNLVDIAYSNGINYFDTAYMYHCGKSEEFIGKALKKYPRETYYLADKLPIWMCNKKSDMERIFNDQLKRTGHSYFDFYLLHSLNTENWNKCKEFGAYEFVLQKKLEGKVKNIGFSFHGTIDDLKEIISAHKWDFAQIQMNYLDWENQDAKTQYSMLTDADIPAIVMEPVRGGKLANVPVEASDIFIKNSPKNSIASWAIGFVASHENVLTILSGMNSTEQLYDNISTLTKFKPFDEKMFDICYKVADIINKNDLIPCTGCDYCSDCPIGVKISSIFDIYNKIKKKEYTYEQGKELYYNIGKNASDCVQCGKCKNHCPQSINIPDLMKNLIIDYFD